MYRFLDVIISLVGIVLFLPVFLILYVIGVFDTGSPLFMQERVGRNKKPFVLVKFRTMKKNTPSVATHLVPVGVITTVGSFMRKTKLDELPQLWNVIKGEMSLVGPRPGLFNQVELMKERDFYGVYAVRPGITGLSQISGIDMSSPKLIANKDAEMIDSLTVGNYFKYIIYTALGKGFGDRVIIHSE